jgi:hypothetical protein
MVPYTANERKAKEYVGMLNLWHMPKSIFKNPNTDYFTLWLYLQKADDSDNKDKILTVLNEYLIDQWLEWKAAQMTDQSMSNSAANMQMSQWIQWQQWDIQTRANPEQSLSSNWTM